LNNFKNNINIDRFNLLTNITMDLTPHHPVRYQYELIFENYTGPVDNTTDIFRSVMNSNPVEFPKFFLPDEEHAYVKHTLFGSNETGSMLNPFGEMVRATKMAPTGELPPSSR